MSLPDGILTFPITDWQNGHQYFTVTLTKDASFNLRLPFDFSQQEKNYQATTKNFQWLIQQLLIIMFVCARLAMAGALVMWQFVTADWLIPVSCAPSLAFEVIVNPHRFAIDDADKGVFLRAMYKTPYRTDYDKPALPTGKFQYGDELLGLVQTILDNIGKKLTQKLVPPLVTKLFPLAFAANEQATGTIGEIFTNTKFRGKAASAAIDIDTANASRGIEEIVELNKKTPFAGALALRFVKGTLATLGFTKFEKTCVLEMDGVESATSRKFFSSVWDRFEAIGLPYTLHWGKIDFNLTEPRIRQMYGDAAVNKWLTARHKLLDNETQKVFTNEFMVRTGLGSSRFQVPGFKFQGPLFSIP